MYVLELLDYTKDLGVTFDCKLNFYHHINEKINKLYAVLSLMYRNFKYMSSDTFVMLYKTLVRSHLEYANCIWSRFRQIDLKKIEKVLMRAARITEELLKMRLD